MPLGRGCALSIVARRATPFPPAGRRSPSGGWGGYPCPVRGTPLTRTAPQGRLRPNPEPLKQKGVYAYARQGI